ATGWRRRAAPDCCAVFRARRGERRRRPRGLRPAHRVAPVSSVPAPEPVLVIAPNFRPTDSPNAPFLVDLEQFSGPLVLLLSLIRDEQVDIYDIPIARVAEQFLARISTLALD